MKKKCSGFGLIEYLFGVVVLVGILFVPVNDSQSLSSTLIEAVKKEHSTYIYVASVANVPNIINIRNPNVGPQRNQESKRQLKKQSNKHEGTIVK